MCECMILRKRDTFYGGGACAGLRLLRIIVKPYRRCQTQGSHKVKLCTTDCRAHRLVGSSSIAQYLIDVTPFSLPPTQKYIPVDEAFTVWL